jgi:outer membrane lipoprotein SlyB
MNADKYEPPAASRQPPTGSGFRSGSLYFFCSICVYLRLSAVAFVCFLAVAAYAQSIRIPNFRDTTPVALKPGEACLKCGVVRSIREVQARRPVTVPGAFQTSPIDHGPGSNVYVGAVVALPFGEGSGKEKPFVGGVGTPEMRERFTESTYEITIRLDDGGFTQVTRRDGASYRIGDRVRVSGTQLELLAP